MTESTSALNRCPGVLCWLALALAVAPLHAAPITSDLQQSFQVSPGGHLVMEVDRGSITLQTGDRAEVNIEVKRSLSDVRSAKAEEIFAKHEVTFEQNDNRVLVRAKYQSPAKGWLGRDENKLQVKYLVSLPKRFHVDLNTAGGSLTVSDLDGVAQVRTSGGNIDLAEVSGKIDAQTAGGSIKLKQGGAETMLRTSGGNIQIEKVCGETKATTAGGSISVGLAEQRLTVKTSGGNINLGTLRAETEADTAGGSITVGTAEGALRTRTSGGNIRITRAHGAVSATTAAGSVSVAFAEQPEADCQLSTSGGDITVSLVETLAFTVDASTGAGSIRTEIPVASKVTGEQRSGRLNGTINGGGKKLVLKASAGRININKLNE